MQLVVKVSDIDEFMQESSSDEDGLIEIVTFYYDKEGDNIEVEVHISMA